MSEKYVTLAVWTLVVFSVFAGATTVRAADNFQNDQTQISLLSNNYPGGAPANWYSPGDPMTYQLLNTVTNPDTNNDVFDIVLFPYCWPRANCDWNNRISSFDRDDVPLDLAGTYSETFDGVRTEALSDGRYILWVANDQYHQNLAHPTNMLWDWADLWVLLYQVNGQSDRPAYLPGDSVTVFYSVTYIKDGSLVNNTLYSGKWEAADWTGKTLGSGTLASTQPQGSFNFVIPTTSPTGTYFWYIWWNGTSLSGATRAQMDADTVDVDDMDAEIYVHPPGQTGTMVSQYPLGSTVEVEVWVHVLGWSVGVEGATVRIRVFEGVGASRVLLTPGFDNTFTTAKDGRVRFVFVAGGPTFIVGKQYTAEADPVKGLQSVTPKPETFFNIQAPRDVISVNLVFNKQSYISGDTMTLTVQAAAPAGSAAPNSFAVEMWSGIRFLYSNVQGSAVFTFNIPGDFTGTIQVDVNVYNAEGDFGSATDWRDVYFGVMTVNADPQVYDANAMIAVAFELTTTATGMPNPTFYYEVRAGGQVVKQGSANATANRGTFTFTVPSVPANSYTFRVYASANGRLVQGQDIANLKAPYVIRATFNAQNYVPGDTVTVSFELTATGTDPLPSTLTLTFSVWDQPVYTTQMVRGADDRTFSGTLTYVVPAGTNEGPIGINVEARAIDGSFLAEADEVLDIKPAPVVPAPPFVEPMEIVLLVLFIVVLLIALMRRGGSKAPASGGAMAPTQQAPQPQVTVAGTGMTVPCRACGKPIEVTTSKRPIEVMCPHCGSTEIVK